MDPLKSGQLWYAYNNLYKLLLTTPETFSFLSAETCQETDKLHWKMLRLSDWATLDSQSDSFKNIRINADVPSFGTTVHLRHIGIEQASFAGNMKSEDVAMVSRHLNDRIYGYLTDFYRPMLEACAGCSAEQNYFVPQEHAIDPQPMLNNFDFCAELLIPGYKSWC